MRRGVGGGGGGGVGGGGGEAEEKGKEGCVSDAAMPRSRGQQ